MFQHCNVHDEEQHTVLGTVSKDFVSLLVVPLA